jgi:hypothetical protein
MPAQGSQVLVSSFVSGNQPSDQALNSAATETVRHGNALVIDRPVVLAVKWTPPSGLILRGDGTMNSRLIWKGEGDAIEVTAPIDIDGITIDGGIDVASTDRTRGAFNCLVGIHGKFGSGASYLPGVRIGTLRVCRTQSVGLTLAHLMNFRADNLELEDVFCTGLLVSGLTESHIGSIRARNVGDLLQTGSRRGSAVAILTETKRVTTWYDGTSMMRLNNLTIDHIDVAKTTDTAVYMHDDRKTGVENVSIGTVNIDTAGKDGFKIRSGPKAITVEQVVAKRIAGVGVVLEGEDLTINNINVSDCGIDSLGLMMGQPRAFSGGKAAGESIQINPVGVLISNCEGVTLPAVRVTNISSNPVTGSQGHGLSVANSHNLKITGSVQGSDGNGLRISDCSDFTVNVSVSDSCRKGVSKQAILVTADTPGISQRGVIQGKVKQGPTGHAAYAAYITKDACSVTADLTVDGAEFPTGASAIHNSSLKDCR